MKTKNIFRGSIAIVTAMLAIGLVFSLSPIAYSQNAGGHMGPGHSGMRQGQHRGPAAPNLTEEQRQELHETVQQLREQGATPEEIHQAVSDLFDKWGIEMPEMGTFRGRRGGADSQGAKPQLTEEQRQQVRETIAKMRQEGASREEIHEAITRLFSDWGLEMPAAHPDFHGKRGATGKWLMQNLSDEQRETLKTKIKELKDQGASRQEIHDAVATLFAEWGIEPPNHPGMFGPQLTEEQRETLKSKVKELKDQGASRGEIQEAIDKLFEEWGIERPVKHFGPKGHKKGGFGKWLKGKLTPDQRQTLHETIQRLKEQGASRDEIRQAVNELLKQWGIEPPGKNNEKPESSSINSDQIEANNYPNPFNPITKITYTLPKGAYVTLSIYNAQGQFIKTIVNRYQNAGNYNITWDGRDANGNMAPSGIYFYRIIAGDLAISKRMILMK